MRAPRQHLIRALLPLLLLACNLSLGRQATREPQQEGGTIPPPTEALPTESTDSAHAQPTDTATIAPAPYGTLGRDPEEAILILEPGPGSRVTRPIRVAGIADPTFEQTLVIRVVLDDGTALSLGPTTIQADLGQRGPFEQEVSFSLSEERNALIQVYHQSARDGGIVHLASVGVTLVPVGPASIEPGDTHPESIQIQQPTVGELILGGVAHVEGIGLASFEGTLVIQIYDVEGNLVGSEPVIVDAPDMGTPGAFAADVGYAVAGEGPGRVAVLDPLPAFDGLGHIASVEVTLAP